MRGRTPLNINLRSAGNHELVRLMKDALRHVQRAVESYMELELVRSRVARQQATMWNFSSAPMTARHLRPKPNPAQNAQRRLIAAFRRDVAMAAKETNLVGVHLRQLLEATR